MIIPSLRGLLVVTALTALTLLKLLLVLGAPTVLLTLRFLLFDTDIPGRVDLLDLLDLPALLVLLALLALKVLRVPLDTKVALDLLGPLAIPAVPALSPTLDRLSPKQQR